MNTLNIYRLWWNEADDDGETESYVAAGSLAEAVALFEHINPWAEEAEGAEYVCTPWLEEDRP